MSLSQEFSRRSLANYASEQILAGNSSEVMKKIAAYLAHLRKTKDRELVISEIERRLSEKGLVLVRVKTARPLSKKSIEKIKKFMLEKTKANRLELIQEIDKELIGGAIISTADYVLDASLKNRLNKLKEINKE